MRDHILGAGRALVAFLEREHAKRATEAEPRPRRRSATFIVVNNSGGEVGSLFGRRVRPDLERPRFRRSSVG